MRGFASENQVPCKGYDLDADPITVWIDELRESDDAAAAKLWNHFMRRLYDVALAHLRPETRRVYDEEDAAQSAFKSFCAGISAGRFPDLKNRDGLWRLLLRITTMKVAERHRFEHRKKRDVRRNLSDTVFANSLDDTSLAGTNGIPAREPSPEFAAQFLEVCESLFERLDDSTLQEVARLRMDGYNDSEIAQQLGCSRRTVQRRIESIRRQCEQMELGSE